MKKIWLIAFLFNALSAAKVFSQSFFDQTQLKLSLDYDTKIKGGIDFKMPVAQLKFFEKENQTVYGFSLFTGKYFKNFPIKFNYGMISIEGSLSKLNSPGISSFISPFSTAEKKLSVLSSSLPSISTSLKENSFYFSSSLNSLKNTELNLSFFIKPEEQGQSFGGNFKWEIHFNKNNHLGFSAMAGLFPYKTNIQESWYSKIPFYKNGNHLCSLNQLIWKTKYFQTLNSFGLYQQPLNNFLFIVKSENIIHFSKKNISFSIFYNPDSNLLTSSKQLSDRLTVKTFVQTKKILLLKNQEPLFCNNGTGFLFKTTDSPNEYAFYFSKGYKITGEKTDFQITAQINALVYLYEKPEIFTEKFNLKAHYSFYFPFLKPKIDINLNFCPNENFSLWQNTQKLNFYLYFPNFTLMNFQFSMEIEERNNQLYKKEFSTATNLKIQFKHLSITGKCSFKF